MNDASNNTLELFNNHVITFGSVATKRDIEAIADSLFDDGSGSVGIAGGDSVFFAFTLEGGELTFSGVADKRKRGESMTVIVDGTFVGIVPGKRGALRYHVDGRFKDQDGGFLTLEA